jgi:aminopeptidase N
MPKLIRANYQPPVYLIDKVNLRFDLGDESSDTFVTGTMHYKLNNLGAGSVGSPLVLNGKKTTIVSASIDGLDIMDNIVETPDDDFQLFTIADVPPEGELVIRTKLDPWHDESCEGLYGSNGILLTQCESQTFRKIMPFVDRPDNLAIYTCEIYGDERKLPVMLSNGNVVDQGKTEDGRHFVKYEDPFPKPSYLFALVAGDISCIKDQFITKSGRKVNLFVHVKAELINKATMAMAAMKAAMRWDEENYDLEYDLDNCHLVGVSSFNAGAMENKGLIIFNNTCLLSDPRISTDAQQLYIWDVVSHEYFHNYAGNRVTVREWLELSLKEGLATRKECDFMTDTFGYANYRINDIIGLRSKQFPEDAGPLSHAVRPAEVESVDNIYTATIYDKGAEVLAVLSRLLGRKTFTEGIKRYFKNNDGKAATIEDFIAAQEAVSGRNLQQFLNWYDIAGTPKVEFTDEYFPESQTYVLNVKQSNIGRDGTVNPPMLMPIAVGLLGSNGQDLLAENAMLELSEYEQSFVFNNIPECPVPSLLRDFTSPVIVTKSPVTESGKLFLFKYDSDPINRWMAGQEVMSNCVLSLMRSAQRQEPMQVPHTLLDALHHILNDKNLGMDMRAELLNPPSLTEMIAELESVDIDALIAASTFLNDTIAEVFEVPFREIFLATSAPGQDELTPELIGMRALHNLCLDYLVRLNKPAYTQMCLDQFASASNMTDTLAAFSTLATKKYDGNTKIVSETLDKFHKRWHKDDLAIMNWLRMQAISKANNAVENLYQVLQHPTFDMKIPNHVYIAVRNFALQNLEHFHRADGAGYKYVADALITVDAKNSMIASRIVSVFEDCRKFDPSRQALMVAELRRIAATEGLSKVCSDQVTKMLAGAPPVVEEVKTSSPRITVQFDDAASKTMRIETDHRMEEELDVDAATQGAEALQAKLVM